MKVTQQSKEFKPITIVLEDEIEAKFMWHCLNRGVGQNTYDWHSQSLGGYFDASKHIKTKDNMWEEFNKIYPGEEDK
jgi:hypothetical protein